MKWSTYSFALLISATALCQTPKITGVRREMATQRAELSVARSDEIHYAARWFRARKQVTELWDVGRARRAHEARSLYTVIVGPVDRPSAFLELNRDFVGVSFLDTLLREYLSYGFVESQPGKLFLKQATFREFVGDTDKVSEGTTYIFHENGHVTILRERSDPDKFEQMQSTVDVRANYDTYPKFGSYAHLLHIERVSQK